MSAVDLPYQLRPNKFIDRQMFADLLARIVPAVGAERYVYISMGGKHLVDHQMVYRKIGIPHLVSFDFDRDVVSRQKFNRPVDDTSCHEMDSGSLPSRLDTFMSAYSGATNVIVWLDYTDPHARLIQLQETVEVLKRLQPNDVLRITLNANIRTLGTGDDWQRLGYESPGAYRLDNLREQLGKFVPTSLNSIGEDELPEVLTKCLALAVAEAEHQSSSVRFEPVLMTSYKDGQRMLTATLQVVDDSMSASVPPSLLDWPFKATGWDSVLRIEAPNLSVREKMSIDTQISRPAAEILESFKFQLAKNENQSLKVIESYQKLHRYYPAFHHVES